MPSVVHVVVTDSFAGVERYVARTAHEVARRGWDVAVVGGQGDHMRHAIGDLVEWAPGQTVLRAVESMIRFGRRDVCHVHMTLAEVVGVATRPSHRGSVVSTRHFASRRGSTRVVRALAPLLARGLAREIAISHFVSSRIERQPGAVIANAVPAPVSRWSVRNRVVLVLQRLEPEKDTLTALRAWEASRLCDFGWSLRIVGDGSQRKMLETWVESQQVSSVEFAGWSDDVEHELGAAGILLAPATAEPFGLSVVEAMAAGVPVVACAGGGHLETVGRVPAAPSFQPGDAGGAAAGLRSLLDDAVRQALSAAGRAVAAEEFSLSSHVDRLIDEYSSLAHGGRSGARN